MEARQTPRAILYKYFPPERLVDIFENVELRFSRPAEFNDTFDSHYLVPKGETVAAAERSQLRSNLGVLCLTERPDKHQMWVHYAKNHTGFALGFDARAEFFTDNGRVLDKVRYKRGPAVTSKTNIDSCFRKSDAWIGEDEWRCVRIFEKSEPRVVPFDLALIREIVFGFRMESWQIARVALAAAAFEMSAKFMVSKASRKSWQFEIEPREVSLCEMCSGQGYTMTVPQRSSIESPTSDR